MNAVPRRNRQSSTYNPTLRTLKILSLITIILLLITGSQTFLSSYPVDIILNNNTRFADSFNTISENKLILSANQIPLTPGDVITLKTGGYLKITYLDGNIEAYKYNTYKLHHNIFFSQNIYTWNTKNPISLEVNNQSINLTKLSNNILVETQLSRYDLVLKNNSFTFVTTDDNSFLYKLSQSEDIITITAIGIYDNIPFTISEYRLT